MNKQKGFTLVEAAVAIGVVGILSGIIIPMVLRNIRSAQIARAKNDIHVLAAAMAAQLRDTGTRPVAAGGPGGATGVGHAVWCSDGAEPFLGPPALPGGPAVAVPHFVAANTIDRLFMSPSPNAPGGAWTLNQANAMFGFTPRQPWAEVGYKGPYLGSELQSMMDPWGTRYVILGYNEHGQATGGPIWIVSAGPRKTIAPANLTPDGTNEYTSHWTLAGLSEQNLVLRVN